MKNLICLHFDHNLDEPTQFLHEFTECSSLGTAATMMTMKDWLHARFWEHCTSFYSVQCQVGRIAAGSPTIFWPLCQTQRQGRWRRRRESSQVLGPLPMSLQVFGHALLVFDNQHTTNTQPTHNQHTTNTQPTHNQHTTNNAADLWVFGEGPCWIFLALCSSIFFSCLGKR